MRALLLGNGVNLLSSPGSWSDLLAQLADSIGAPDLMEHASVKPFALLYEEIALRSGSRARGEESELKRKVADLTANLCSNSYHQSLSCAVPIHILTTNYDYNLEKSFRGEAIKANIQDESRYSAFRRREIGGRFIWHIHGELQAPDTILLGYDHYSGQLQKLRNYATADRDTKQSPKSPFKLKTFDFESSDAPYSWVDVFLRDEVHIIGLTLDYTEIDLWWLLAYKKRLHQMSGYIVGETVFHHIYRDLPDERLRARLSILRSFGVEVREHSVQRDFAEGYDRVLEILAA